MQYIANLLHVDLNSASSVRYFLMLTQIPADGKWESRTVVEGAHMGYESDNALTDAFRRAKLREESVGQLRKALDQNSPLVFVGVLTLDSQQLRAMGFQTLARMIDVLRIS